MPASNELGTRTPRSTRRIGAAAGHRLGGSKTHRVAARLGGASGTLPLDPRNIDPRDAVEARARAFNRR